MVWSIQPTRLPVLLEASWRMMVNGISACKRLETCRLVANFALSLPLSCVTTTHPSLQSYGIITRPSYVMICTIGLSFPTTLTPLRTRSMIMASISLTASSARWASDSRISLPSPFPSTIGRSLATSFCRMSLTMTSLTSLWMLKSAAHPSMWSRGLLLMLSWPLLLEIKAGHFSFTVLEVEARHMSAIPLLQQCVQGARWPSVLHLQALLLFSWMVGALHTLASKSPFPFMSRHPAT